MTPLSAFPVPFVIDFANPVFDQIIILIVAILVAILIQNESQAMAATILGDDRPDSKKRHHFNAFLHLDIWGFLCFFIAGFGWGKKIDIDSTRFKKPALHTAICRSVGPLSNFLMANIAASLVWLVGRFEVQDTVFSMVVAVNVTVFVYSIIPISPLAGGAIFEAILPKDNERIKKFFKYFNQYGPYIIVGLFLILNLFHINFISELLDPVVRAVYSFIMGF